MKKFKKNLSLVIILFSFMLPFSSVIATPKTAQTSKNTFIFGDIIGVGDWDPSIYISTPNADYIYACLESLTWTDSNSVVHPVLATNWTIYPRPNEGGHSGGIKAIAYSLRQGVTFHDGSEWNATVAKWNLDRTTDISGNLSGTGDFQNRDIYWVDASEWEGEFTPNWNLSWYKSNPFGLGPEIPLINKTEIINNYLINITFNTWTTQVMGNGFGTFESAYYFMISMESYKDWAATPIYGFGENPEFPQDNPAIFPGHLIGTGPYLYDYVDETITATGHMVKNNDYWNKTALEAAGVFSITDVYIRHYVDFESQTTALLTGEVDYLADLAQVPITDIDAVIADPLLNYVQHKLDPSIIDVTFKCEEGLNTPTPIEDGFGGATPKQIFPSISHYFGLPPGTELPDGVNRTIRRALSYSFDYETFTEMNFGIRGTVSQSSLGLESRFYNPSIPQPYYNVTRAREILLSDPYYAARASARGLGLSNSTDEWNIVATTNPIVSHNIIYDGSDEPAYMMAAFNDIGCELVGVPVTSVWVEYVATGLAIMYDMFHFVWPNDDYDPWYYMHLFFTSKNRFIPYFGYNFDFMANSTIDQKFTDTLFKSDPQAEWDFIANHIQNYDVPYLYICQYMLGFACNRGFDYTEEMPDRVGFSGVPYYAWMGGERYLEPIPPEIPGYNIVIILFISISAMLGIIYVIKRRNL